MTVKVKIALAVAAAGGLAYWYWRKHGSHPPCSPGATWYATSDTTGFSAPVAESIRKWGGYCRKPGFVDFGDDFVNELITQPSQLP